MVLDTVLEIAVALLSVVGLYSLLGAIGDRVLSPRQLTVAVVIREPVDAVVLDILLDEAMRSPARRRGRAVQLLLSASLFDAARGGVPSRLSVYRAVAERYRASVYVVEPENSGTP